MTSQYAIDLCVKMLQYAAFAETISEMKPSEVKASLEFIFTKEEIEQAVLIVTGRTPT